jgi:hypothetical protein
MVDEDRKSKDGQIDAPKTEDQPSKVNAALDTPCPKGGYSIPPSRLTRVDLRNVVCPECGEKFVPGAGNSF